MSSDRPEDSFATLFEETSRGSPRRRGVRVGDTFDAIVVQVGRDAVFVEVDGHQQGFIDSNDLRGPDGTVKVGVGDVLRARVVHHDAENGFRLAPTLQAVVAVGASVSVGAPRKRSPSKSPWDR